jgi:exonuclease SbcD
MFKTSGDNHNLALNNWRRVEAPLKAFSFVHAADLHLGYSQYGLEARREDFEKAFGELVDRSLELKPDFMILAGDLFHQARPSNTTLESAVRNFSRLRDAKIPVLTVDGSHDSAPNAITGTILNPLDSAGLVYHLPRHDGSCWRMPEHCYVYGLPNYRTRRRTEELLPAFLERNNPQPDSDLFNILVFHMGLDLPDVKPPYIEAEAPPELIPDGFEYYAAGHVHTPYRQEFKSGLLVYPGCTETTDYVEAKIKKGFYYINVDERGQVRLEFLELKSPRKFVVLDQDYTGVLPSKIAEQTVHLVRGVDESGVIIIPVLRGTLPVEARRTELDVGKIRNAAEKAFLVHPVILLRESEVSDEVVRSIFESEFKDLKTKAFEYFVEIFSERHSPEEATKIAHFAVGLIDPLLKKQEEKVKESVEELLE